MVIGPERWRWVSIDTPGVPTGGKYGNVEEFVKLIEPHGWKLAWSKVWNCFCLYEERPDGTIADLMHFVYPNGEPIPLSPDWIDVFKFLREEYAGTDFMTALAQLDAEMQYEANREYERQMAETLPEAQRAWELDHGAARRIVVPQIGLVAKG